MNEKYDAIIIGSGCGGGAAAALASYHGWKTLLLEQSKHIGGRCCTYERDGFKMDHGHIIARGRKGPHGTVLKMVKCEDLIPKYFRLKDMAQKMKLQGKMLKTHGGWANSPEMLWHFFKSRYIPVLKLPEVAWLFYNMIKLSKKETKALDQMDLKTFLSQYTDVDFIHTQLSALSSVMYGVLSSETSAGEFIRTLQSTSKNQTGGYPVNGEGVSAIPKSFIKAAQRYGADVRTRTPVDHIVIEDGEAKGVMVQGELIKSKVVISNAGIKETTYKLAGKEHFNQKYINYLEGLRYSYGGISVKYAIDKPIVDFTFGGKMPMDFERHMTDALQGRVPEETSIMMVCTTNMDPSLAPKGKQVLVAISPGPVIEPGKMDWEPWVSNLKRQIEEEFVPGLSDHTIFCDVSTPDVIARHNKRIYGDAVGVAQTTSQVGDNAPPLMSPIKNLFHVGADVGSKGIATEMATESAIDLFKLFKQMPSLVPGR